MNILRHSGQPAIPPFVRKVFISLLWRNRVKHALMMIALAISPAIHAEDNPYASGYQPQNQGNLHSLQANPEPQIFKGTRRDEDNINMLENGYDLMGTSSFESTEVPADLAVSHGRTIQADSILVYFKKAGNTTPASKMEMIKEAAKTGKALTEKDMAVDPTKYRYYATYWAKLPPPVLGVHVIKLVPRKSDSATATEQVASSAGVRVIAVIHDSAAEKGGVLRGDQLLAINKEKVEDAAQLSTLVRKYRGKTATLKLEREGEPLSLEVQL